MLDTDNILGDSEVYVQEGSAEDAREERTSGLTQQGVSPIADSKRTTAGLDNITERIMIMSFLVGISAVIFGLTGICAAKIRKCPCTCTFGVIALILTIFYGFCSYVMLLLYYVSDQNIKDFCDQNYAINNANGLMRRLVQEVEDYVFTMDKELIEAVDDHMCRKYCPCEGGWDYGLYGTTTAATFASSQAYNFNGEQIKFTECYAERKSLWVQEFGESYSFSVDEDVIDLMKSFEEDYGCSGLCRSATFFASKDIREGPPPPDTCIYKLKESFDDDMVMIAWAIVATGFMCLLMFCCHCGLYLEKSESSKSGPTKRRFIFD